MAALLILCGAAPNLAGQHGPANEAELSVKKLQAAPGLKVELFAAEPLLQNPVAFSIDERGRFFIAESHRWKDSIFDVTKETNWLMSDLSFRKVEDRAAFLRKQFATNLNLLTKDSELVRLVEDRDGDGRAETSSVLANGFNETVSGVAAGILARKGDIWFTSVPDLWKISSDDLRKPSAFARTNGSANPRIPNPGFKIENIATGFGVHIGVSGHDLHGLAMGPDGKIYFSSGDRGFSVRTREGKILDYPDTGGVLRCNPDGSDLEVFAIGLRNPQELAFDQYGNLFTDDNDTAGADPSRMIYVVEGGDYGWRASYQFMQGFGPWVQEKNWRGGIDGTLPYAGEVSQGPAGLAFYPGTGLPEKYQNHFFACDFPQGVWSFSLKPKGAGFEVIDKEKFLWNLGPTDVEFGPDGAAYVCDWGTSYNMPESGRIYRVFDPAQKENPALAEGKKLIAQEMEERSIGELTQLLKHANQRVRQEAQFELVNRALAAIETNSLPARAETVVNAIGKIATGNHPTVARVHAIWAIAQIGHKYPQFLQNLRPLLKDKEAEIIAQATIALGSGNSPSVAETITPLLLNTNSRVRFFAAAALGKLKNRDAIPALLELLKENADQDPFIVHAGIFALETIGDLNAIQSAATNANTSVRRAALLVMRRKALPEIAQFLSDPEPKLVTEAARAINDAPIIRAFRQLAATIDRDFSNFKSNEVRQVLCRAINANFRLGQAENAMSLARFSARASSPDAMRAEALDALSNWENPNPLDRVMGLWRPLGKREIAVAQNAFHSVSSELFQNNSEEVLLAAVTCSRKLKLNEPSLFPLFQSSHSSALRAEILQALTDSKSDALLKAVELALADSNSELRREGIKLVAVVAAEQTPLLLEKLLATETDLRIRQTAFAALGKLTNAAGTEVLLRQLNLLLAGKIAPELELDVLDAAKNRSDQRVARKIDEFSAGHAKDDLLAELRVALVGGNAERGKKIFYEREDVACLRCHAINGQGGNVGPDLNGIAAKRARDYLLESVALPNRQIAAGFENIVVRLKNQSAVAGLVKSEDKDELVLNSPEDGIVKIKKGDIENRERGLSPMPEGMANVLTKSDLRDLIEFLASLK